MTNSRKSLLRASIQWVCAALFLAAGAAHGACSSYAGQISINEYNLISSNTPTGLPYVELKVLNPGVVTATSNFAGWTVRSYTGVQANKIFDRNLQSIYTSANTSANNVCGPTTSEYIRIPFGNNELQEDANLVLSDGAGNVVDVFRVSRTASLPDFYSGDYSVCARANLPFDTDLANVDPNRKNIQRLPDGTGNWAQSPSNGNNSEDSLCTSNDNILLVTKITGSPNPAVDTDVAYAISIRNGGNAAMTNVTATEVLPAGLNFVSATGLSQGSFSSATGVWAVGSLAAGAAATMTLTARTTAAGQFVNTVTGRAAELGDGFTQGSATINVTSGAAPGSFNACHDSTACPPASRLFTRIAGVPFALNLAALKGDGSVETTFSQSAAVSLVSGSCPAGTVVANLGTSTFASGRATVVGISVPSAQRQLRVRIDHQGSSYCSGDAFAIRPSTLTLTSNPLLNNASLTGLPKAVAGSFFTLAASSGVPSGYDGIPAIAGSVVGHDSVIVAPGTLVGAFGVADGISSSGVFSYHDVGRVIFAADAIRDTGYTVVDQAAGDCLPGSAANTPDASGRVGCWIGSAQSGLGRFIPARFNAQLSVAAACGGASGFTYLGQDALAVNLQVTAESESGTVLSRYNAALPTMATLTLGALNGGAAFDSTRISQPALPAPGFTAGAFIFSDTVAVDRLQAGPDGPFDDFRFSLSVSDPQDAVVFEKRNGVDLSPFATTVESDPTRLRYGRLRMSNAYGSELTQLPVPLLAESWTGSAWAQNTLDACTALSTPLPGASFSEYQRNLNVGETSGTLANPLAAGNARLILSAPGAGNAGAVRITIASPVWLKYRWDDVDQGGDGDIFDDDPSALISFGVSRNNFIFMRENY
ncbi:MAG TPA: DUF11 domain-containing protein [Rhodocyclaceae bacterium]